MIEQIKKVLANVAQNFTSAEKLQARTNIGAAAAEDVITDAVRYTEQSLITSQKTQARTNINAAENVLATQSSNGLMSSADKEKLDGIQSGAEANVQSDWNQTNTVADDYIKNKPTLAAIALSGSWNDLQNVPSGLVIDSLYVHTDNNFTDALKSKLDGIEAGATKVLIPNDPSQPQPLTLDSYNLHFHWGSGLSCYTPTGGVPQLIVDPTITTKLAGIEDGAQVNVQADWTQADNTADDYIKNKPSNLVQDASYVHTDNNFSDADKTKLGGIAAGAEVNVQADWNQTDSSADDYIKNKPSFVTPVNADWNASSGLAQILNKPNFQRVVYGGTASELTGLKFDADDPTGYVSVTLDSDQQPSGYLIAGPYKALLDSGVDGLGDSSEGVYIDSDGTFKKCTKNVVYVGLTTPYADVLAHVNANREVILRVWPTVDNPLFQDFRLMQYNPDGSMEFSCVTSGYGTIFTYKYMLFSNGVWQRTNTSATTYQGILIEGIGRNLHLNQNNQVQTNLPGGLFDAPASAGNNFERIDGADFAGAYKLACRHNVSGTYEIAIAYTASGTSSTYWFLGTETIVATDNTITTKQAVYNASAYYTPSNRFGGTQSTAFDPSIHRAIIYNGVGLIGPCSDCKIAIFNDNGTVKIAFTAIEVGKVGATN